LSQKLQLFAQGLLVFLTYDARGDRAIFEVKIGLRSDIRSRLGRVIVKS